MPELNRTWISGLNDLIRWLRGLSAGWTDLARMVLLLWRQRDFSRITHAFLAIMFRSIAFRDRRISEHYKTGSC